MAVDLPEIRTRAWYIEVSWERIDKVSRAVKAAAKAYEEKFCAAALHRGDFSSLLKKGGLPTPAEIHRDAAQRRAYEPRWRRWLSDYHPTRWPITVQRPEGEEFHCLNNPDPSAVIAFWRDSART